MTTTCKKCGVESLEAMHMLNSSLKKKLAETERKLASRDKNAKRVRLSSNINTAKSAPIAVVEDLINLSICD